MVVVSDPAMSNKTETVYTRVTKQQANFAGVFPRRDAVKADVVFVFAGSKEIAGGCSFGSNGSLRTYAGLKRSEHHDRQNAPDGEHGRRRDPDGCGLSQSPTGSTGVSAR